MVSFWRTIQFAKSFLVSFRRKTIATSHFSVSCSLIGKEAAETYGHRNEVQLDCEGVRSALASWSIVWFGHSFHEPFIQVRKAKLLINGVTHRIIHRLGTFRLLVSTVVSFSRIKRTQDTGHAFHDRTENLRSARVRTLSKPFPFPHFKLKLRRYNSHRIDRR